MLGILLLFLKVTESEKIVSWSGGVHLSSSEQPVSIVHSAKQITSLRSCPIGSMLLQFGRTNRRAPFDVEAEGRLMQVSLYGVAFRVSVKTEDRIKLIHQ